MLSSASDSDVEQHGSNSWTSSISEDELAGEEESKDVCQIDLLKKFCLDSGDQEGSAGVYHTADGTPVAVSRAHHYAYRDDRLACFNAHEFHRAFICSLCSKG